MRQSKYFNPIRGFTLTKLYSLRGDILVISILRRNHIYLAPSDYRDLHQLVVLIGAHSRVFVVMENSFQ